ncbi:MAG: hypothetical protein JWP65_3119, partial [Ramlibacter sp.]|nr:hypothetical protein [Ramlibacter sp.]
MSGARTLLALVAAALLAGCSYIPQLSSLPFIGSAADKAKPAELQPNPGLLGVRQAWTSRIGPVTFPLGVNVSGSTVTLASSDGNVVALDGASGRELWRASA